MNTALVKIDVAAADLGVSVRRIETMFEGADQRLGSLVWVFDFARVAGQGARREPRFWRPELLAAAGGDGALRHKYDGYELDWVIDKILPVNRGQFHAGEVDQLFQIRHNTRMGYAELNGEVDSRGTFYARATLVAFLKRRWLGAVYQRSASRTGHLKDEGKSMKGEGREPRSRCKTKKAEGETRPLALRGGVAGGAVEIRLADNGARARKPASVLPKIFLAACGGR